MGGGRRNWRGLGRGRRSAVALVAAAGVAMLAGCTPLVDVGLLQTDGMAGRNNNTAGSTMAQDYILDQLRPSADGLNTAETGDEAYLQHFTSGTNIVGIIPGGDLADEYVVVGAHYDHVGSSCRTADPTDTICNGATDNATGVAAALQIARRISAQPTPPRRSVVIAFWDREEDGLLGSQYYVQHPLVPLEDTVAYVNFDIQGANLLPSLRSTTFAVGAESGGTFMQHLVDLAAETQPLDTVLVSSIFGQGRSDYVNFLGASVPSVFFTDSTGPCYHTAQDQFEVVDFHKLDDQIATALRLVRSLARAATPPKFKGGQPLATFADALAIQGVMHRGQADLDRFSPADQVTFLSVRDAIDAVVAAGEDAFDDGDIGPLLLNSAAAVNLLTHGDCDGFLEPPAG